MNPFRVGILQYAQFVFELYDLENYLPPPSYKGGGYDQSDWTVRDKELFEDDMHIATIDVLITSIQDDMDDKEKHYFSLSHE